MHGDGGYIRCREGSNRFCARAGRTTGYKGESGHRPSLNWTLNLKIMRQKRLKSGWGTGGRRIGTEAKERGALIINGFVGGGIGFLIEMA